MRARKILGASLAMAIIVAGTVGANAGASAPSTAPVNRSGTASAGHLEQIVRRGERAVHGKLADPGSATLALLKVSNSLERLSGRRLQRAKALLARPTDANDPEASYSVPEATPVCTTHFCIHYVTSTKDAPDLADPNANGIPDYVEAVEITAEDVYSVENGTLGWKPAKADGKKGGNALEDIYLAELGSKGGLFGYAAPDPGQGRGRQLHAHLVIDDDFLPSQYPGIPTALVGLQVTLAHEYNHILQFGYDRFQDTWMLEATATWMEEQVYPDGNDYLRYVPSYAKMTNVPLTFFNFKVYGSAVWNHWLSGRYGQVIVRKAWENALSTKPGGLSAKTYDRTIRSVSKGKASFLSEFSSFSAATAEWRALPTNWPDVSSYTDIKRNGTLRPGGFKTIRLNHTTSGMFDVPNVNGKTLTLKAAAPRGTKSAIALVGRKGPETTGQVIVRGKILENGGIQTVKLPAANTFDRITVVLVNADFSQRGFFRTDWLYTKDRQLFGAALKVSG